MYAGSARTGPVNSESVASALGRWRFGHRPGLLFMGDLNSTSGPRIWESRAEGLQIAGSEFFVGLGVVRGGQNSIENQGRNRAVDPMIRYQGRTIRLFEARHSRGRAPAARPKLINVNQRFLVSARAFEWCRMGRV